MLREDVLKALLVIQDPLETLVNLENRDRKVLMVQKVRMVGHAQYVPKEYKGTQVKLGSQECLAKKEKKETGVKEVKQD